MEKKTCVKRTMREFTRGVLHFVRGGDWIYVGYAVASMVVGATHQLTPRVVVVATHQLTTGTPLPLQDESVRGRSVYTEPHNPEPPSLSHESRMRS